MEVLNKILPLILTAIMSINLSGCGNSTVTNDTNTVPTLSETSSSSSYISENITADSFCSLLMINGKTISFPCTVSELLNVLGNECSCELGITERNLKTKEYDITEERQNADEYIFFDFSVPLVFKYDDKVLFSAYIHEKDYTGIIEESKIYKIELYGLNYAETLKNVGIDITIADKLNLNSPQEDVQSVFGKCIRDSDGTNDPYEWEYTYDIDGCNGSIIFRYDGYLNDTGAEADPDPKLAKITYSYCKGSDVIDDDYIKSQTRLPKNMSMDDMLNGLKINDNTLRLGYPTTLHDIISTDSRLSYRAYDNTSNIEDQFKENNGQVQYCIYYDDIYCCRVVIYENEYTGDPEKTELYSYRWQFSKQDFDPAKRNISLFSILSFESGYNEIVSCLGLPNQIYDYQMRYLFSQNNILYTVEFVFDTTEFSTSRGELCGINISISRSDL